jgi:glycosyltransferase involved in cell wall biosynthesis
MELTLNNAPIPTLCLNMIVKNESRIIKRLLDSVISIIDTYCICDTGSTDNTVEIIEKYFNEKGIKGKIINEPFKNFCHNRTLALKSCLGLSDYILLLDADMVLEVNSFDKSILNTANSFSILQGNDSFYYQNLRIVRNNGLYKYVGVTHEYIDTPQNNTIINLKKENIFIRDIGDGGSKTDKFERDIKLLLDGIKEEPNSARYHFYLANSYHDCGRFGEAINVYKKRIEMGGWKEEVWYSYYRIGLCFKNMNKMPDAIYYWLQGYNYYPQRLEGIYEIINHYRITSNQKLCMVFYNVAKEILDKNENRDSYLFLHNDIYLYKIYYEYTIFAGYCGITNINNEAVTVFNRTNGNEIDNILSNMKFYKQILQKKNILSYDNSITSLINNENVKLLSSSSCLLKKPTNDGFYLNVRYVNYYIDKDGSYKNCEKHIITVNKFVEFDNNFSILKDVWMNLAFDGRKYIGVEDVKIYYDKYKDKLIYIGTGYHSNNKIGIVSGDYDVIENKFQINELKQNFKNTGCEKNWIFVDYKDETHIIYEWSPLKICKLGENNEINIVEEKKMPNFFSRIRGSTCGFVYNKKISENKNGNITIDIVDTEIWFINHIVSYENPRHYYHVISVFDENMNLLRYSGPLKFEGEPIEYCLSIVVQDERVLINYSVWDRTTKIGIYDKSYIDSLLNYT